MNINELRKIIENAPDGATHYEHDAPNEFLKIDPNFVWFVYRPEIKENWINVDNCGIGDYGDISSLSDIKLIIELYEQSERLKKGLSAIANWEKCSKEDTNEVVELLKELARK